MQKKNFKIPKIFKSLTSTKTLMTKTQNLGKIIFITAVIAIFAIAIIITRVNSQKKDAKCMQ